MTERPRGRSRTRRDLIGRSGRAARFFRIRGERSGNNDRVAEVLPALNSSDPGRAPSPRPAASGSNGATANAAAAFTDAQLDFVWRLFRRLGFAPPDAEDATQDAFVAVTRRAADIIPGRERSFLIGTALNVAATRRRSLARRRESPQPELDDWAHPGLDPETLALERWRVELLDQALKELGWDLRVPFVLFELEELTTQQIADSLHIPTGTVASRLRRARKLFHRAARRLRSRGERGGGP